jgi:DNA-binding FadR family transcriptional regulator
MGIQAVGSTSTTQSAAATQWQQQQQNFKNLSTALQSGNLAAAQQAFSTMIGGTGTVNPNSPLAQVGQALQTGDLAGAQKAMQQLQANRAGGHHHHHQSAPQTAATGTGATGVPAATGPGSLLSVTV